MESCANSDGDGAGRRWRGDFAGRDSFPYAMRLPLTVNVVDATDAPVTNEFRWLLEEDNTVVHGAGRTGERQHRAGDPQEPCAGGGQRDRDQSGRRSRCRTRRSDTSSRSWPKAIRSARRAWRAGQTTVTVVLNKHKIPTAQITFVAFVDHDRINNAIDETDPPLGGVKIIIDDAILRAGRVRRLRQSAGHPLSEGSRHGGILGGRGRQSDRRDDGQRADLHADAAGVRLAGNNPDNLKVGEAVIKNLPPGKYGTIAIPPDCRRQRKPRQVDPDHHDRRHADHRCLGGGQ